MASKDNKKASPRTVSAAVDPTLPYVEIELAGKTYKMCLDFESLAAAEKELEKTDPDVSLIEASWRLPKIRYLVNLFAASLRMYHPEIPLEDAKRMVTWKTANEIILKLRAGQLAFFPEKGEDSQSHPPSAPSQE